MIIWPVLPSPVVLALLASRYPAADTLVFVYQDSPALTVIYVRLKYSIINSKSRVIRPVLISQLNTVWPKDISRRNSTARTRISAYRWPKTSEGVRDLKYGLARLLARVYCCTAVNRTRDKETSFPFICRTVL